MGVCVAGMAVKVGSNVDESVAVELIDLAKNKKGIDAQRQTITMTRSEMRSIFSERSMLSISNDCQGFDHRSCLTS